LWDGNFIIFIWQFQICFNHDLWHKGIWTSVFVIEPLCKLIYMFTQAN
jgi:hypothetical protein